MVKTVLLCGDSNSVKIMQLEMEAGDRSLDDILHEAAMDYCKTEEGRRNFLDEGGLSYEAFFNCIPEEIRRKYGIQAMHAVTPDLVVDGKKQLLNSSDVIRLAEHFHTLFGENGDVCKVAVRLAEMWGVMETLDGQDVLAECGTEQNICRLIAWAEEYVSGGHDDLPGFFEERLRQLRK